MNIQYAFLMTFFASISTFIGGLVIYLKIDINKLIKGSLLISCLVMSFISVFDLIPEGYKLLNSVYFNFPSLIITLISVNVGILISFIFDLKSVGEGSLEKIGWLTFFCIVLHNLLEGVITFVTISYNINLGIKLFIGIFLHNIPEGIILASLIYGSKKSKSKALVLTLLSGFQELAGAIISYLFFMSFMNKITMGVLYSIVAGIMLYLSIKSFLEIKKVGK